MPLINGVYRHGANMAWTTNAGYGVEFGGGASTGLSSPAMRAAADGWLTQMQAAGMNTVRWFLFPYEPNVHGFSITVNGSDLPTGFTPNTLADLDTAIALLQAHNMQACFPIFSHVVTGGPNGDGIPAAWRDTSGGRSALLNTLAILFSRYASSNAVFAWELSNELTSSMDGFNTYCNEANLQTLVQGFATTVHANSPSLACSSSGAILNMHPATDSGTIGRIVGLGLDFYLTSWYHNNPTGQGTSDASTHTAAFYTALDSLDKPLIISEFMADTTDPALVDYQWFHNQGYAGAWGWSASPGANDGMRIDWTAASTFGASLGGGGGGGSLGGYDVGTYDTAVYSAGSGGGGSTGGYGIGAYGTAQYGVASSSPNVGAFVIGAPHTVGFSGVGGQPAAAAIGNFVIGGLGFLANGGPVVVIPPPPPGQFYPVPIVEISFNSNPFNFPIWQDVSQYVENFQITRGRQRELDQVEAGTLQMQLVNTDRRFDPTYTSGPYYPNVLPVRKIRIRAFYNNTIYPVFAGYIESWGQEWLSFQDAVVPVTASDAFKPLNLAQLNTSYPAQTSDARINAVLNTVGWTVGGQQWVLGDATNGVLGATTVLGPTGDRSIGAGQTVVAASTLTNTSALQHMQDVTASEFGMLFARNDGTITFYGRNRVVTAQANQATFGELELPYQSILLNYDDTDIWNDIQVTASGGVPQVATDFTSRAAYFQRTLSLSTIQNSDVQALSLANLLLSRHSQPLLQITSITLDGTVNPVAIFPQMLTRDLGEQVTAVRRPPAGGPAITQPSTIQGIDTTYDASAGGEWLTTWRLSPIDTSTYWTLGDAVKGLLGTTTRLFF